MAVNPPFTGAYPGRGRPRKSMVFRLRDGYVVGTLKWKLKKSLSELEREFSDQVFPRRACVGGHVQPHALARSMRLSGPIPQHLLDRIFNEHPWVLDLYDSHLWKLLLLDPPLNGSEFRQFIGFNRLFDLGLWDERDCLNIWTGIDNFSKRVIVRLGRATHIDALALLISYIIPTEHGIYQTRNQACESYAVDVFRRLKGEDPAFALIATPVGMLLDRLVPGLNLEHNATLALPYIRSRSWPLMRPTMFPDKKGRAKPPSFCRLAGF